MQATGAILRDMTRALLVLALAFFNFAHAPASQHTAYDAQLTAYLLPSGAVVSDCGESSDDGHRQGPCHACRIGGAADLPSPPWATTMVGVASTISYPSRDGTIVAPSHRSSASPRAPPLV